jgi:Ca2+-dependent lipid-binding protein
VQLNPFLKLSMKKTRPVEEQEDEGAAAEPEVSQEKRTRVIMAGNTSPTWNQDLVFDIDAYQKTLSLVCYDEDLIDGDAVVGTVEVDLTEALNRQGETVEQTVILQDENVANRGEVQLPAQLCLK